MQTIKYTPIKCYKTNVALLLGDKVKDCQGRYGFLDWDECFNSYYIRPENGGKIKTQNYIKVEEIEKFKIDTTKVECRKNPLKKKW